MARKSDTPMKRCTKTGEILPMTSEFFYKDKSSKDGFSPWSKAAEKAYNRAYYAGLKQAKVTRKGDIAEGRKGANARKAFEAEMTVERVKRGTHRSKVSTPVPAPSTRTRTSVKPAQGKSTSKGNTRTRKAA